MFTNTITLFNFHETSGLWHPVVITGADVIEAKASTASTHGKNNASVVDILINCTGNKIVKTENGDRQYIGPKAYAKCEKPEEYLTFTPQRDFIYEGVRPDLSPVAEDDYESGLYHELNSEYDGVYLINSAAFYSLIPHFEIGGK